MRTLCSKIYRFYRDGFAAMRLGKTLWLIILVKLFILFAIIKPFFFPDFLQSRFRNNTERAAFVYQQLRDAAVSAGADGLGTNRATRDAPLPSRPSAAGP